MNNNQGTCSDCVDNPILDQAYLKGMLRATHICRSLYKNSQQTKSDLMPLFDRLVYEVETDLALHQNSSSMGSA